MLPLRLLLILSLLSLASALSKNPTARRKQVDCWVNPYGEGCRGISAKRSDYARAGSTSLGSQAAAIQSVLKTMNKEDLVSFAMKLWEEASACKKSRSDSLAYASYMELDNEPPASESQY